MEESNINKYKKSKLLELDEGNELDRLETKPFFEKLRKERGVEE